MFDIHFTFFFSYSEVIQIDGATLCIFIMWFFFLVFFKISFALELIKNFFLSSSFDEEKCRIYTFYLQY